MRIIHTLLVVIVIGDGFFDEGTCSVVRKQTATRLNDNLNASFPQFGARLRQPSVGLWSVRTECRFGDGREIFAGVKPIHDLYGVQKIFLYQLFGFFIPNNLSQPMVTSLLIKTDYPNPCLLNERILQ